MYLEDNLICRFYLIMLSEISIIVIVEQFLYYQKRKDGGEQKCEQVCEKIGKKQEEKQKGGIFIGLLIDVMVKNIYKGDWQIFRFLGVDERVE